MQSQKLASDIRITHITDFHGNKFVNLDKVYDSIKSHNPNFIVLTGDMSDVRKKRTLAPTYLLIERLKTLSVPIFFVFGNHDQEGAYKEEYARELEALGVRNLYNESTRMFYMKDALWLTGITTVDPDYKKALESINKEELCITLCHKPDVIIPLIEGHEDFILCGHTHGGQARLPLIGAFYAPGQGFMPKIVSGIYHFGDVLMYIDSGLGNSRINIRTFNRIQFSNITISNMH